MTGLRVRPVSRVRGRPALIRRLRGLLIATHRYGRHRAATHDDQRWTARLLDALTAAIAVADASDDPGVTASGPPSPPRPHRRTGSEGRT